MGSHNGRSRYGDEVRGEAPAVLRQLRELGIKRLVMATGDMAEPAQQVGLRLGLTEILAAAFPQRKAELVQELKRAGHTVAVIGDGINDSPALAHADVGISLRGGSDAAQQSAEVILTDDNLERLPQAIRIARNAMGLVRQNLVLTVIPNGGGIALAAAGAIGPPGATFLNNGSAVIAALNSLRPLLA